MIKLVYVVLISLAGTVYSMQESMPQDLKDALIDFEQTYISRTLPADLQRELAQFVAGQTEKSQEKDRYSTLRGLLQGKQYSDYTPLVLERLADIRHRELIESESKYKGRKLTDDEQKSLRDQVNQWYIAVELGTPGALEWIKQHPPANTQEWNYVRDAFNAALRFGRSEEFIGTLAELDIKYAFKGVSSGRNE